MLSLKRWHSHPHFCKCFYDMEQKLFAVNAMTDRGYAKLIEILNRLGYDFPAEPESRATMAMFLAAKEVIRAEG